MQFLKKKLIFLLINLKIFFYFLHYSQFLKKILLFINEKQFLAKWRAGTFSTAKAPTKQRTSISYSVSTPKALNKLWFQKSGNKMLNCYHYPSTRSNNSLWPYSVRTSWRMWMDTVSVSGCDSHTTTLCRCPLRSCRRTSWALRASRKTAKKGSAISMICRAVLWPFSIVPTRPPPSQPTTSRQLMWPKTTRTSTRIWSFLGKATTLCGTGSITATATRNHELLLMFTLEEETRTSKCLIGLMWSIVTLWKNWIFTLELVGLRNTRWMLCFSMSE